MRIGVGWDRRHTIEASVLTAAAALRTIHTFVGGGEIYEDVAIEPVRNTFLTFQYRRALALSSRTDLTLGIGTSLTKLDGGSAYDDLRKQTYFGPMGSVSLMTSVGSTKVVLSIADAMYSIQYIEPVNGQTSFMQHDLLVTAGLQVGGWK